MELHFFGRLADALGPQIEFDVDGPCSVVELRSRLAEAFPDAAGVFERRTKACIGDTIVPDTHVVQPNDRVEFFPPVSGG